MVTMIESIDKVFGHLVVEVNVSEERIRTYFKSMQEPRFVEIIIRNRKYYEVPFITSRICGACSI
ncbi:MAG TPA: Ni/Fe hydrogenase subunit alpha, partial [Ignisphaera sp.]|nr:Ni/Fe hydrogenase subunit alpha [Ignisphaera sp.]